MSFVHNKWDPYWETFYVNYDSFNIEWYRARDYKYFVSTENQPLIPIIKRNAEYKRVFKTFCDVK